jgi:hypothetical protein
MTPDRVGPARLRTLQRSLSPRDMAIITQVAKQRLMSARQIEVLQFSGAEHSSPLASARACRRVLERLVRDRLLSRLERRVGGVRSGSASYIYALDHIGHRVLALDSPRKRFREPTPSFTDHTLAVSQLVVDLTVTARDESFELLDLQAEPACWRRYAGNTGMVVVRPDLYVAIGSAEYEYRWFVEVDRGTEHLPTLLAKCRVYDDYYRTGIEQRAHKVFPRVCWVVPDRLRAKTLVDKITGSDRLNPTMFVATTAEASVGTLAGGGE